MHPNPCVVSIAGSDSSGGAGIQADIKTISATGCYAASVITALTAQNTQGVQAIQAVSSTFAAQQMKSVFDDLTINAVKIGMLHNQEVIQTVAVALQTYQPPIVILDPVMIAKSGHALLNEDCITSLKHHLFSCVTLLTPNVPEAEKILGTHITHTQEQENAAKQLGDQYQLNVLIKGGHMSGETASDVLYEYKKNRHTWFHAQRIPSPNTHGTGCSLSSAIASYLAQGHDLPSAIKRAKHYLTQAILASQHWHLGKGTGPINHFYFLESCHDV